MKIVSKYQHQKLSFRNWLVILTAVLFPFTILLAQSKGPAKGRGNPAVAFEVTQLPKAEASVGEVHVHPTFPSKSSRHEEQIKSAPAADVSIEPDISGPGSNPENLIN